MKNRNNNRNGANFPQQTHFIGVLLPEDITLTLEDCRRYMREAYGCKSGHATPIHVTLVPPFRLPEEYTTEDLARAIESEVLPKGLGFTGHIDNFDAFGDRTLFAKVVTDEKWVSLRDAVYGAVVKAAPGCTKKDNLKILKFDSANRNWLEYVTANRKNMTLQNDDYDIVIGPVANDRTMPVISLYFSGIYDIDETIRRLLPQKLHDQYTFRTEKSLKALKFVEVR